MLKPSLFLCAIAIFALSTTAPAIADEPILLTDLEENPVNPLDAGDKKAVVLFFISPYCPTSNTFAPYDGDHRGLRR